MGPVTGYPTDTEPIEAMTTQHDDTPHTDERTAIAIIAFVCASVFGVQLAVRTGLPLSDADPPHYETWSKDGYVGAAITWLGGFVAISALLWRRRLPSPTLASVTAGAAFAVAALVAWLSSDAMLEFATSFSGGWDWFSAALAFNFVVAGTIVGIPTALLVKGRRRRRAAAVAVTSAVALLFPVVRTDDVLDRLGSVAPAVIILGPPVAVAIMLRRARRPGGPLVPAVAVLLAVAQLATLGPVIALATRSGYEDAVYSQSWLSFLGLSALWFAVSAVVSPPDMPPAGGSSRGVLAVERRAETGRGPIADPLKED